MLRLRLSLFFGALGLYILTEAVWTLIPSFTTLLVGAVCALTGAALLTYDPFEES